jgi:peptidyl-tRNA hydrolase, PTH1 family
MKIIFAQGNPESKYNHTRHNVGFWLIDAYAKTHDLSWIQKSKFKATIAEGVIGGEKIILVKPTTYYNDTGISARILIDFYSLDPATDLLVIHDDLALPIGTIRTRGQGSDAGNNGIKSLNAHIGPAYHRIRVGIWTDLRDKTGDIDFVLGTFTQAESDTISLVQPAVSAAIDQFIAGTLQHHTHVHTITT